MPEQFENATITCKANIYFDGKVVSHTVHTAEGERKTLGIVFPGEYTFDTAAAEIMEIQAGTCRAKLPGSDDWQTFESGSTFDIPANAVFEIAVDEGTAEYICSYV